MKKPSLNNLPFWGLAFFSFMIPLEEVFPFAYKFTFTKLIAVGVLYLFVAFKLFGDRKVKFDKIFVVFCSIACWGLITGFGAVCQEKSVLRFLTFVLLIGLYLLFVNYCDTKKKIQIIMIVFVLGILIAAVIGLKGFLLGQYGFIGRFSLVEAVNPNLAARNFVLGILMLSPFYFIWLKKNIKVKALILAVVFLFLGLIMLTQSRTSWILLPFWCFSVVLFLFDIPAYKKILLILGFVFLTFGAVYLIGRLFPVQEYFVYQRVTQLSGEGFQEDRGGVWLAGLRMFLDHPIVGVGWDNFSNNMILGYFPSALGAHNSTITIAAELGLIGLGLWGFVFFFAYKQSIRIKDKDDRKISLAFLFYVILLFLVGGEVQYSKSTWFLFVVSQLFAMTVEKERYKI